MLLADDIDPAEHKKEMQKIVREVTENSFEVDAREWHVKFRSAWASWRFNCVPVPALFIQEGRGQQAEAVAGHFLLAVAWTAQDGLTVLLLMG